MITINDKTYSGNIVTHDAETLSVMIYTNDSFQDVLANTLNVNQVADENAVHMVTGAMRANVIEQGIYYIVFSCKPTLIQEMQNRIQQQDSAIDEILVMLLEGEDG